MPLAVRRAPLTLLALLLTVLTMFVAAPARAEGDPTQDVIRDLEISIQLDAEGTAFVTETFQWDFGTREGRGFYRELVQHMGYEPDPDKVRVLEYSNFEVSSPSGAPADVWVESTSGSTVRLAVGAPDGSSDIRTGVQTYVLTYEIRGALNAIEGQDGVADQEELYLNLFTNSPNVVDHASATVYGPADVTDVACYVGDTGSTTPCESYDSSGTTATFAQSNISAYSGFTVMAAFPPGTFANTDPILADKQDFGSGMDWPGAQAGEFVAGNWPWLAAAWAALLGLLGFGRARSGRDKIFEGIAPGNLPAEGMPAQEVRMRAEPPVSVRFTPPDGLLPAQADVIEDEAVTDDAIAATMVDLAVRGYLTIAPAGKGVLGKRVTDWELTLNPDGPPRSTLTPWEDTLMRGFFGKGSTTRISKLRGSFASNIRKFKRELTANSDTNKWFQRSGLVGTTKTASVFALLVFALWWFSVPTVALGAVFRNAVPLVIAVIIAIVSLGVVWKATKKAAHGRSATGRALYEQVRGFREYLSTAEAHQLRWEDGEDIFSKYLPWAIIFGVADRWSGLFEQLAAEGRYTIQPTWYVGSFDSSFTDIGDSVTSLSSSGTSSLSYTPGSSGSSGSFGGGGGFSGGGVGGGGFGGR